jgi:hypothetical protein
MEPQMNADERRLNRVTEAIIGCAYHVANALGVVTCPMQGNRQSISLLINFGRSRSQIRRIVREL